MHTNTFIPTNDRSLINRRELGMQCLGPIPSSLFFVVVSETEHEPTGHTRVDNAFAWRIEAGSTPEFMKRISVLLPS
jgi:hypothetical protein